MRVDLNLISSSVAKELSKHLVGLPSETEYYWHYQMKKRK